MNPYPRTIVCPLLRENCLSAVLRYAGFLAKCTGARLLVANLHDGAAAGQGKREACRLVPEAMRCLNLDDVHYECFEVDGDPVSCICAFARERDADLVVLGNDVGEEGTPALGRLTRQIVDGLPCTVVVVKDEVRTPFSVESANAKQINTTPNCTI